MVSTIHALRIPLILCSNLDPEISSPKDVILLFLQENGAK
jgi:hypothetical protein